MVFNNNFKGAMSLVTEKGKGGIMPLNEATKREMALKHPKPSSRFQKLCCLVQSLTVCILCSTKH